MLKCPFCGFANEDGALFCEQCKSDLSSVTPEAPAAPPPVPAFQFADEVPMAAVIEDVPLAAMAEAIPLHAGEAPPPGMEVIEALVTPAPAELPVPPPFPYNPAAESDPPHAILEELAVPAAALHHHHEAPHHPAPPPPAPFAAAPPPAAPAPAAPAPAAPAPAAPAPAAPAPAAAAGAIPAGAQVKLVVVRGQRVGMEFPIYGGENYIGRADEKPVDVDLEDQEPPERVWTSRQHAVIHFDDAAGSVTIEDLNSSNGTYVNRAKVYPGQPRTLALGDVVQIGTVHLKLKT